MRHFRHLSFACLLLALLTLAQAQSAQDFTGTWQGSIDLPGDGLEVEITLQFDEAWQGSIDIPAQGAMGVLLENIAVSDDDINFSISGIQGEPSFEGRRVDDRIEGTFTQGGQDFPFELHRAEAAEPTVADPTAVDPIPTDPVEAVEPPEDVYEDPEGRFTAPIPTGWTVTEAEGHVRFDDPEEAMHLYLLTVEEEELETAIIEAWARVDPDFAREAEQVQEPPSDAGIERTIFIDYGIDEDRIHQAFAQLHEGMAYVLLVDADLEAAQRRDAQLDIVLTGFQVAALEDDDLRGVEPLPVVEVLDALEAFIHEGLEVSGIPGAAIAIAQNGEVVYAEGFGVKEAGGSEPITPDTQMMIGSTGKTLTTMLMAILVDEGLLDWDTRVVEVLPQFAVADPELTEEITVRHLVCACTGVPRRDLELFFNADSLTAEGIVASLQTFEFFTDFGEAFQYSNQLVATGGYAAAASDGAEFGRLYDGYDSSLQERVLEPIGMTTTTLSFAEVRSRAQHGIPHQLDFRSGNYNPLPLEVERALSPAAPAGAHWSTASDMAQYLLTQLNTGVAPEGTRVVSEENLITTWEPQVPMTATESYGLGWMVGEYQGLLLLHHGGNTLGFTSDFAFLPDANVGIVVLTNAQGSGFFNTSVRTRLFELVFEQPSQAEEMVAFGRAQLNEMVAEIQESTIEQVDAEAVEPFLSSYTNEALGEITLTLENGRFVMDAGELSSELRPVVNEDGQVEHYLALDGPVATRSLELLEEEGAPVLQLGEGVEAYTFTRVE